MEWLRKSVSAAAEAVRRRVFDADRTCLDALRSKVVLSENEEELLAQSVEENFARESPRLEDITFSMQGDTIVATALVRSPKPIEYITLDLRL